MTDCMKIAEDLDIHISHVCLVGSKLICGEGKDFDFLCLVNSPEYQPPKGYSPDIDQCDYETSFSSFRIGDINILLTSDEKYFWSEVSIAHAAKVAKQMGLDLTDRDARVAFHCAVRDAVSEQRNLSPFPF